MALTDVAPLSPRRIRGIRLAILSLLGLAFYLWPAARSPVVKWSDSTVDLRWAHDGTGIWKARTGADAGERHPLKPGYLLFLRLAESAVPGVSPERSIVLFQSLLLWAGTACAAILLGRRHGTAWGITAYVCLLAFLPVRDAASAVMSEAVTAALLVPLASLSLGSPPPPEIP